MNHPGPFDRLRFLREHHLRDMSRMELAVYLAQFCYADAAGRTFVSPATLARDIGHSDLGHVFRARRALERRGLQQPVRGGKRGEIQLLAGPPILADSASG